MSGADAARGTVDRTTLGLLTFDLYACVLTQKIAIPVGAAKETEVALALFIHLAVMVALAAKGRIVVVPERALAYLAFATIAIATQIRFADHIWSPTSMGLMLVIASFFVFATRVAKATYDALLRRFVTLAIAASFLVGVDWAAQAVHLPFPNLDLVIPERLIFYSYNYIQPLHWGSPWTKANGVIFLETSHASQFIAMGLVVEAATRRRLFPLAAMASGLVGTFGGTGLLLVAICAPALAVRLPKRAVLAVVVALPFAAGLAAASGFADSILRRTTEFEQGTSSANNRFVLPLEWVEATLSGPGDDALLGTGAGSMPKSDVDDARGGFAWPPYTKVLVEYGLPALLTFLTLVTMALFRGAAPLPIALAAATQYHLLNGSLNVPIHTIYCVLLASGYVVSKRARHQEFIRQENFAAVVNRV